MSEKDKILLLLIMLAHLILTNDIFDMYFTRLDCIDRNNTVSKNLRCSIKRFRNNSNLLNGACDLNHVPAIFVRATLYYKFGLRYKPFALNFTRDVCDLVLLEPSKRGVDVNIFYGAFEKHSNLIRHCPYEKGHYQIDNMPATSFKIPPFTPAGEYRVDFRLFTTKNRTLVFARVYFTIKAKGLHILAMG